jgi:hypothetical protein
MGDQSWYFVNTLVSPGQPSAASLGGWGDSKITVVGALQHSPQENLVFNTRFVTQTLIRTHCASECFPKALSYFLHVRAYLETAEKLDLKHLNFQVCLNIQTTKLSKQLSKDQHQNFKTLLFLRQNLI